MNINSLGTLQLLYCVAFINGMGPFYFSTIPPAVARNRLYRTYTFLFVSGLAVITYTSRTVYFKFLISENSTNEIRPMYFVYMMLTTLSWIKIIWLFIIDLWNESELIQAINDAFELQNRINLLAKSSEELYVLQIEILTRSVFVLRVRVITLCGQLIIIFVAIAFAPLWRQTRFTFEMFVRIYITYLAVIRTTLQYAAFFVLWKFYFHLNLRLKMCMATLAKIDCTEEGKYRMRMQVFCDLSDEIDRLAMLYERCRLLTEKFASLFKHQILWNTFYSGGMIISQV